MIPRGCAIERGGYGRPLTRTIFGLVFVCRVTGTLRTTLCSGAAPIAPPGPFSHARFCSPGLSLSLSVFLSLSLSAWPLGPAFRNWSCQTLTSNCPQNALEERTEHNKPRQLLSCLEGGHAVFFLATRSVQEFYPTLSSKFFFCRAVESWIPNRRFPAPALYE